MSFGLKRKTKQATSALGRTSMGAHVEYSYGKDAVRKKKGAKLKRRLCGGAAVLLAIGGLRVAAQGSDSTPPVIEAFDQKVSYDCVLNIDQLASISDDQDEEPVLSIEGISPESGIEADEEGNIHFSKAGEYVIALKGTDSHDNYSEAKATILVYDDTAPVLTQNESFKAGYGEAIKSETIVEAVDGLDGKVKTLIVDAEGPGVITMNDARDEITFEKPGSYVLAISAKDSCGNEAADSFEVAVVDTNGPKIKLKDVDKVSYTASISGKDLASAKDEIDGAVDVAIVSVQTPHSGQITVEDNTLKLKEIGEIGTYQFALSAKDASGNTAKETIELEVIDDVKPKINLEDADLSAVEGRAHPHYYEGVSAIDEIDGDLTSEMKVDDSDVDYYTPGEYTVWYSVSDTAGNKCTKSATVTIEDFMEAMGGHIVFITETGERYHLPGCYHLNGGGIEVTIAEAIAMGKTDCSDCNPLRYYDGY